MPLNLRETFPFTHEQAVATLYEADWSQREKETLLNAGVNTLHNGIGNSLRTAWGLKDPTYPLSKHYRKRFGLGHADDMSQLILRNFVALMRGESFSMECEVSWLKKHWLDQGVNPLTLERIS
jgi:hypothetical protein